MKTKDYIGGLRALAVMLAIICLFATAKPSMEIAGLFFVLAAIICLCTSLILAAMLELSGKDKQE